MTLEEFVAEKRREFDDLPNGINKRASEAKFMDYMDEFRQFVMQYNMPEDSKRSTYVLIDYFMMKRLP